MPDREGGTEEGEGAVVRYDASMDLPRSREVSTSAGAEEARLQDREVWSASEVMITDADVEAGLWRRAEAFED